MTRHLKPNLDVPRLQALGGEYEGVIVEVREELLRNRFNATTSLEPVLVFEDGKRSVLNKTLLQKCLAWFGAESDNWIGRRVRLFLRQDNKGRWQRAIACEDPHARVATPHHQVHPSQQLGARERLVDKAAPGREHPAVTSDDIPWEGTAEEDEMERV